MYIFKDSLRSIEFLIFFPVVEDIIRIISLYDSKDMLPKTVYFVIDPWLFNELHLDVRYKELIPEYNGIAEKLRLHTINEDISSVGWSLKLEQAFSPTYFQASIKNIRNRPPVAKYTDDGTSDSLVKLSNGGIVYPKSYTNRGEATINDEVISLINAKNIYHSTNYEVLSPVIVTQFMRLFNYLESKDVKVVYILSPIQPTLYDYVAENEEYMVLATVD